MTPTERWLVAFLCLLLAGCLTLGGTLIYLDATRPSWLIEGCPVPNRKP